MSWLIFPGNLAKMLFLDIHATIFQFRTNLDIFMVSTVSRSWQYLYRFNMVLIKVYHVTVQWEVDVLLCGDFSDRAADLVNERTGNL